MEGLPQVDTVGAEGYIFPRVMKRRVFPTHVGMNQWRIVVRGFVYSVPHARGDEPAPVGNRVPHARGDEPLFYEWLTENG